MAESKKATKAEGQTAKTVNQLSYVGPNIPNLGLSRYQVYIGGYPKCVEEQGEKEKALLASLFVPIANLAEVMKTIEVKGSFYNTLSKQAQRLRKDL